MFLPPRPFTEEKDRESLESLQFSFRKVILDHSKSSEIVIGGLEKVIIDSEELSRFFSRGVVYLLFLRVLFPSNVQLRTWFEKPNEFLSDQISSFSIFNFFFFILKEEEMNDLGEEVMIHEKTTYINIFDLNSSPEKPTFFQERQRTIKNLIMGNKKTHCKIVKYLMNLYFSKVKYIRKLKSRKPPKKVIVSAKRRKSKELSIIDDWIGFFEEFKPEDLKKSSNKTNGEKKRVTGYSCFHFNGKIERENIKKYSVFETDFKKFFYRHLFFRELIVEEENRRFVKKSSVMKMWMREKKELFQMECQLLNRM